MARLTLAPSALPSLLYQHDGRCGRHPGNVGSSMTASIRWYDAEQLRRISEVTIAHYDRSAEAYWDGTRDHDVSQNYAALLDAIEGDPPLFHS